jgi:hypothetical protein
MEIKKQQVPMPVVIPAAVGVILALMAGCEFDNEICSPDESDLAVSPSSVFLEAEKTNRVEFMASGGQSGYVWSISTTNLGTLSWISTNGAIAFYQSTTNAGTNVLTVRDIADNYATARVVQN